MTDNVVVVALAPFLVVRNSLIFWKDEGTKGDMGWNDTSQARSTQLMPKSISLMYRSLHYRRLLAA